MDLTPARQIGNRLPLDHPHPGRPHRIYVALTNHCNRSCPWCSTCSSPAGSTWLHPGRFLDFLPEDGSFEIQIEGGEPTIHPDFLDFVRQSRDHPRCTRLVICTNGTVLPRTRKKLYAWLEALGEPVTLKLSINHHLLEHDPGLVSLALEARDLLEELGGDRALVLNVRLRKGVKNDDMAVRNAVIAAGLEGNANIFFLQRYGFASGEAGWEPPFLAGRDFRMVNPDGQIFGPDLVARSEAMRFLP